MSLGGPFTVGIGLEILLQRDKCLLVVFAEENLLGGVEVYLLLLGLGLSAAVSDGLRIGEIGLRFADGLIDGLYRQHGVVGILALRKVAHHLLVVTERLVVLALVAGYHAELDERAGDVGAVLGIGPQGLEAVGGHVVAVEIDIRAPELIHRLGPETGRRRCLPHARKGIHLLLFLAGQAICQAKLVVRIDVVGVGVALQHGFVTGCSGFVVPPQEVAVRPAHSGVLAEIVVAGREVCIEPLGGILVVAAAEEAVGDVVGKGLPLLLPVEGGAVVQVGLDVGGLGVLSGVVVRLGQPVTRQLVEGVAAAGVEGRGLQALDGVPPRAVIDQLIGAQIIGFHVVAAHVGAELVDIVISLHRAGIVVCGQPGQSHVTVDVVSPLGLGVVRDIVGERLAVLVEVESEFGVVEHGVLTDDGVIRELGRFLEVLHGLDLVLHLEVGIGHLVGSDLTERVGQERHPGEILHGTGVVLEGIEDGTRIEIVRTGLGFVREKVLVEILLGLVDIALHEVGL